MNLERSQDPRNLLFIDARSYNRWLPREVTDDEIRAIYDLMKWGPTSANCSPARFVFVRSESGKARLAGCVSMNNRVKVEQAPFTVIVGMDEKFADRLPFLFPHAPSARHWFADQETARITAIRNSSLQGAYFMLAARLLGLDCGPMSGFDNAKLDAEFFGDTSIKSNFIFALGHGASEMLFPRAPRLEFGEACQFA
jgi:3-hydroxypropanoate dehydrogenase